jgi:hypothetical protein
MYSLPRLTSEIGITTNIHICPRHSTCQVYLVGFESIFRLRWASSHRVYGRRYCQQLPEGTTSN